MKKLKLRIQHLLLQLLRINCGRHAAAPFPSSCPPAEVGHLPWRMIMILRVRAALRTLGTSYLDGRVNRPLNCHSI